MPSGIWKPIIAFFGALCCIVLLNTFTTHRSAFLNCVPCKNESFPLKGNTETSTTSKASEEQWLSVCQKYLEENAAETQATQVSKENWLRSSCKKFVQKYAENPRIGEVPKELWQGVCPKFLEKHAETRNSNKVLAEPLFTACLEFVKEDYARSKSVTQPPLNKPWNEQWLNACKKYLPETIDLRWGSHVVVLLAALFVTDGKIVEFGCGNHSTPLIHNFCMDTERLIISADTELGWLRKFTQYESPTHHLKHVDLHKPGGPTQWEKIAENCANFEYDVILIDHHPGDRRTADAIRVKKCGKLVVLHDTEDKVTFHYGPIFEHYKFSYETQQFGLGNMVMSNFGDQGKQLVNDVETLVNMYLNFKLQH